MTDTLTPTAPPLREPAAATTTAAKRASTVPNAAPADPHLPAAVIAASEDPAALLTRVVLEVAGMAPTAVEQGLLLNRVQAACSDLSRRVRETLLNAVDHTPGDYAGFDVIARSGSRRVDYVRLQAEHPAVFGDVVTVGNPTLVVRYQHE